MVVDLAFIEKRLQEQKEYINSLAGKEMEQQRYNELLNSAVAVQMYWASRKAIALRIGSERAAFAHHCLVYVIVLFHDTNIFYHKKYKTNFKSLEEIYEKIYLKYEV